MALINCAECGRSISDSAPACPGCGAPIAVAASRDPTCEPTLPAPQRAVPRSVVANLPPMPVAPELPILVASARTAATREPRHTEYVVGGVLLAATLMVLTAPAFYPRAKPSPDHTIHASTMTGSVPVAGTYSEVSNPSDLKAHYALALLDHAYRRWNESLAPPGVRCRVTFTQVPGGHVTSINFFDCPFADPARSSIVDALRAASLPYEGFESVFEEQVTLTFCHPEPKCRFR